MYYFKATVKTLKIKEIPKKSANNGEGSDPTNTATINIHEYIATFSYCETFKGFDKKIYAIAYDNNNPINTIKLDEDQDLTTNKEIFDFLCSMKDEKLLIGFDKDTFELKEVSLEND